MTIAVRFQRSLFLTSLLAILGGLYAYFRTSVLLLDENLHFHQIQMLQADQGEEQLVTMFTTYHQLVLDIAVWLGQVDIPTLRAISLFFSGVFVLAVWWANQAAHPDAQYVKTLQVICLPIVFTLLPLLYTDIMGAVFPVLAFGFYLRRQFFWMGLASGVSLCFRQTNIIWMLMLYAMTYVDAWGWRISLAALASHVRRHWIFLPGIALFAGFLVLNGGVAMGSWRGSHTIEGLYPGNVFSFVLFFLVGFLPLVLYRLPQLVRAVWARPLWLLAWVGYLAAFYLWFSISHEWNLSRGAPPLLRNLLLQYIFDYHWAYVTAGIVSSVAFMVLATEPLRTPSSYLLYLASLVMFLPISLVEPRYHLLSFVYLVFVMRCRQRWLDAVLLLWLLVLSVVIAVGHHRVAFFI